LKQRRQTSAGIWTWLRRAILVSCIERSLRPTRRLGAAPSSPFDEGAPAPKRELRSANAVPILGRRADAARRRFERRPSLSGTLRQRERPPERRRTDLGPLELDLASVPI